MSDSPASAEQMRTDSADPRWHTTGSGPFILTTTATILHDGTFSEFRCRHLFMTIEAREAYRKVAQSYGLRVEMGK